MDMPKLTAIAELVPRPNEIFVAAGGFEERALTFPELLTCKPPMRTSAVLLEYLPRDRKNKFAEILSFLTNKGCKVIPKRYNRHAPGGFDVAFRKTIIDLGPKAICLDISGMSRLAVMITVDVVRELNLPLRIVYAEALRYAPSKEEFNSAMADNKQHLPTSFVDTGVYDLLRIPRLSSVFMQNHPTLVIAFDSFNEALCQALVNVTNPSRLILVNGRPPRGELRWREDATAYVHRHLRQEWSIEDDNEPVKTTSTLHYEETYNLLVELYWKFSSTHRIILAPTGSKMQTLGSYLLRAVHEDIHVEYPTVEGVFANKYSTGVREKWELDFGRMVDFVAQLRKKELKDYLDLPEELVSAEIE